MDARRQGGGVLNAAVIVAALGYFVDIYDLILFSIVRVPSLKALGFAGETLTLKGALLMNMQMTGMLLGGIFWGILGDKRGRLSVLFGSILLYSSANILNGMVVSIEAYAFLRLLAGVGLAGELGAGITLVSEILPKEKRGYGTTIVASVGLFGALLASFVADRYEWRTAYYIGGGLGLVLLILRVSVFESSLFQRMKAESHRRGDFLYLFTSKARFLKYLRCILIGVPVWYVIGILVFYAPEFAVPMRLTGPVTASKAVFYSYFGLAVGDITSGLLSQFLGSRRKVVLVYLLLTVLGMAVYVTLRQVSPLTFYAVCFALGFGAGYWAIFVTVGAEQFGTNLRATVTTTVPNFVRGSVVLLNWVFVPARAGLGLVGGALALGLVVLSLALISVLKMEETFSKDLNYLEPLS